MAEKKYYWLKLPNDFFKDRVLKKLRRMAGGAVYTIIYQKLLLLSLENQGKLFYEGVEDTFISEMALELDESNEDVEMTMLFLQKNNLIEKSTDSEYFLPQIDEMIGQETDSARRMRKMRNNNLKSKNVTLLQDKETLLQKNVTALQDDVTKLNDVTKCYTEIEIEKDIEKEKEKENKKTKKSLPQKISYFEDILLTKEEYEKLVNLHGEKKVKEELEKMSNWKGAKGTNYKSDYKAALNWFKKAEEYQKERQVKNSKKNKPVQSTNYEQRIYDDEYYESFYDNINAEKKK